jgi:membrane-associated phospholipid phosphatase
MAMRLTLPRIVLLLCAAALVTSCAKPAPLDPDDYPADVAIAWNARVLAIAEAEDKLLTLKGVRTAAMMHIAMHDALNAIHREYTQYAYAADNTDGEPVAAAAQAAYEVVLNQYPGQQAALDGELDAWLKPIPNGDKKATARAIGRAAASAILVKRQDDRWNAEAAYKFHPMAPGVYAEFREHSGTPQGFVFGAGWATARPFALTSPHQFRSPPPPAIDSEAYVAAYDEVREVGRFDSKTRTADQSHLALWWKEFVESSHNRLARELAAEDKVNLWKATRMFALLNTGVFDAYLSSFDNKFFYNHWRPYTAIRWAANDGNPRTTPEPDWTNTHKHTYPFPSYPSAHGTACGAATAVLADTFGEQHHFTMTTTEVASAGPMSPMMKMDPPTRSFDSFSAAAMECALSRVYLGIHFRYDSVEGNRLGKEIGSYALEQFLTPARSAE